MPDPSQRVLVPRDDTEAPPTASTERGLPEPHAALDALRHRLLGTSDLAGRLKLITDEVVRIFGADFARIWMVRKADLCESGCRHAAVTVGPEVCRDRTRCLHLMASSGRYARVDGEHRRVPLGCYKIGRLARGANQRLVTNDATHDENIHDQAWAAGLGLVAFAGCRLVSTVGSPIGVLAFFRERAVAPAELDLLQELAATSEQVILVGEAEQALRESEERYRQLVDSLPVAAAVHVQGKIVFMNPEALHTVRAPALDAVIGRPILDFVHPDYRSLVMRRVADAYERKANAPLTRERFLRLDGEAFDVDVLLRPVTFEGQPAGQVVFWDVTDRRRGEEALAASETRWRVLGENAPAFIMTLDAGGRILSLNRAYPGSTVAGLVGTSVYEHASPEDSEKVRAALQVVFERRERVEYEVSYVRRDGTTVWLLNNTAPIEQDGRVVAAIHVSIDISERKRAEQTLRDSEERYRHLLEGLPDGVIVGCAGRVVFANASAMRLLGVDDAAELVGRPAADLVHPEDRPGAAERARRVVDAGERAPLAVERFLRRDGTTVVVEAVGLPIRHRGEPAVQLVFRDITDRRRAEAERNRLFDLSLDMLCVAGLDGRFKELNPAWTAALGWDRDELKSRPWLEFVHPEDVPATIDAGERLSQGRSVMLFVNRYRCKDGSYRRLSWNSVSVPDEGLVFAVVRDVTERLRLEEQLRQAEKMTALGQLAGGVAHDFNNQLAGILGYAELLRERVGDNELLRRYAEGIVTGAQRSARLTQQLLAFARKGKYQVVPVALHEILDEVLAILEHSIDKRIMIRRAFSTTPIQVVGDPAQLQNALLNLAINARDAMPEGGELALATEVVTVDQAFQQAGNLELAPGRYACIRISDTGIGMDEATRRRAFEPFFTTKEPGRGTGLGLSAAYGIVRNHLGALRLDSAPGRGTRVEVLLPLAVRAPEAAADGQPSAEASFLRILLVDDEDLVRAATADMLKALGHTVRECRNGREAAEVFAAGPGGFDLVILDMIMPLMSGADALAQMRSVRPGLRAILSSGYSLDDEAQRLLGQGSLGLIQKPFTISDLAEAIARAEKT
jgi:PAS domain S-box-containing protein